MLGMLLLSIYLLNWCVVDLNTWGFVGNTVKRRRARRSRGLDAGNL